MNLNDFIFAFGSVFLLIALVPAVISKKEKPPFKTSFMTGSVLGMFALNYLSLNLILSGILTGSISALWFVLAIQKWRKSA